MGSSVEKGSRCSSMASWAHRIANAATPFILCAGLARDLSRVNSAQDRLTTGCNVVKLTKHKSRLKL